MGDVSPDTRPVLVVTGTRAEARVLRGDGIAILTGGGDAAGLAEKLARMVPHAAGVVSFGMAGALVSSLALGDWVIGARIVGGYDGASDPRWVAALHAALPGARVGAIHADGALAATLADKARADAGGALAIDMESHLAAAAADRAGLPFVALRCISDSATRALPRAVAVAMRPDGGIALGAVLRAALAEPGQMLALARVGYDFARAYAMLRAGSRALPSRLGLGL